MTAPAHRRWWRKKRTAALLLWLLVAYPLSLGPVNYVVCRGWVPHHWVDPFYVPALDGLAAVSPDAAGRWLNYGGWWQTLAFRHVRAAETAALLEPLGLAGLSDASTRGDVAAVLGVPVDSGGGETDPERGYVRPWVRYRRGDRQLLFEFEDRGGGIWSVTEPEGGREPSQ